MALSLLATIPDASATEPFWIVPVWMPEEKLAAKQTLPIISDGSANTSFAALMRSKITSASITSLRVSLRVGGELFQW
ncbi:MAG: hypothetical protein WD229_09750 [Pirellulales bacterium]